MFEEVCGSRLTTNIGRIGGMERDFTPNVSTPNSKIS
jgi:NADH-quinone oxidoreductase subunit D